MAPDHDKEKTNGEISIHLDKTDVRAGEMLRGKVELCAHQKIPARGIRLKLRGHETSIRHTGMGRSMKQTRDSAVWFDDELTLFGNASSKVGLMEAVKGIFSRDDYPIIEPGTYSYDFEYQLPDRLPGDYESTRGDIAIRYELRAYVDIPLRVDIETALQLTVYETQRHSDDAKTATESVDKRCHIKRGGHVQVKAAIDQHAYKLGDDIQLTLDIDNQCFMLVEAVVVGLEQTETVNAHGESDQRDVVLARQRFDKCKAAPNEQEHYELTYRIPPELYPTIEIGRLINVSYTLHIELPIHLAMTAVVDIPIRLYEDPGLPGGQGELEE